MSTIQIVGIAVAAVIVLLLVIALIVTRKPAGDEAREDESPTAEATTAPSFLDAPPKDTLERLGKPERRPDEATVPEPSVPAPPAPSREEMPAAGPAAGAGAAATTATAATGAGADEGLGLDWDHPGADDARAREAAPKAKMTEPQAAAKTSRPEAAAEPSAPAEAPPAEAPPAEAPALPAEASAITASHPADESETIGKRPEVDTQAPRGKLVPLSSIIVTTSTKMVDLEDPEVRRMLTELVTFEIDQATQYREQGQTVDAVLQLTEAEKICRALGKLDTARAIRDMMRGLQT